MIAMLALRRVHGAGAQKTNGPGLSEPNIYPPRGSGPL
jgi:hypothetical protein